MLRAARSSVLAASSVGVQSGLSAALVRLLSDLPSHTLLEMPALSPTATSGELREWLADVGDELGPGDILAKIGTDKAAVDFEMQDDVIIAKLLCEEGDELPLGAPIAVVVEDADDIPAFADYKPEAPAAAADAPAAEAAAPPAAAAAAPAAAPPVATPPAAAAAAAPAAAGDRVFASPFARKTARDAGIALAGISGSGPKGRIIADDVSAFLASGGAEAAAAASQTAATAGVTDGSATDFAHSGMRRAIASRLTESKQTVPHYYLTVKVELDALLSLRSKLNATLDDGSKLSVNDFVLKASALAMDAVPEVNSSWLDDVVRQYHYVDIAVAIAVPDGLVAPVVRNVHHKGLSAISASVRTLAEEARESTLAPEDFAGGTFTVSNLGMYGVDNFAAIITPPHACILAVGAAERAVVPAQPMEAADDDDGALPYRMATQMKVTLSCDHRVVDGAVGAQWLAAFRGFMESPETMML